MHSRASQRKARTSDQTVEPKRKRYTSLLALIIALAVAAVVTMIPGPAARPNDLGYYSICSFAPWSALVLLLVAGVIWAIRQYLLTLEPPPEA